MQYTLFPHGQKASAGAAFLVILAPAIPLGPPAPLALHESTCLSAVPLDSECVWGCHDSNSKRIRLHLQNDQNVHAQPLPKLIVPAQYHYFTTVYPRANSQRAPPRSGKLTCCLSAHSALQNSVAFPMGCKQGRNGCVILGPTWSSKSNRDIECLENLFMQVTHSTGSGTLRAT